MGQRRVEVESSAVSVLHPQSGMSVPGVCLSCNRCDHEVKVAGDGPASFKRGYVMLRAECPQNEGNYYICLDEPEDML